MNSSAMVERIARAVLYEGYILYPYRPSTKNRRRWTFGAVCPQAYSEAQNGTEACLMQTQCVVVGDVRTSVDVSVRFLHVTSRIVGELLQPMDELPADGEPLFRAVDSLEVDGRRLQTWQEAEEREIRIDRRQLQDLASALTQEFSFPARRAIEAVRDSSGRIVAVLIREQQELQGSIELRAEQKSPAAFVLTVKLLNLTPVENPAAITRDEVMPRSLVSAYAVLEAGGGKFVSMADPPPELGSIVEGCKNIGTWPVLVGDAGDSSTVLSSPIILSDYPEVAPESPGDLFDGTEIDEILTLRILTLTDDEKREIAATDDRARSLLARTEALSDEQLMRLHGTLREFRQRAREEPAWEELRSDRLLRRSVVAGGIEFRVGDRVRLWPQRRSDIFDLALRGKTAVIADIEQDYEDRIHLAVTVDDDPGSDFGMEGRPAHRFFFSPEEVVLLDREDGGDGAA
jgi:hypothetical protein